MIDYNAPALDQAEISLFGPGIGECIVIHTGEGKWFIVDSCFSPGTKTPIALEYLKSLSVDVSDEVVGLLVTHWHRDHISGASTILAECRNAVFYSSAALMKKEAFHLSQLYKSDPFAATDKEIKEFRKVIEYLKEKNDQSRFESVGVRHTFFDQVQPFRKRLVALSPSAMAQTQAIAALADLLPMTGEGRLRKLVGQSENLNAVALHFTFGTFSVLLGSDLVESGNQNTGWSGVLGSNIQSTLNLDPAQLFKVPHHGSETGHHAGVWGKLLNLNPISIATPISSSGLPNEDDIQRISDNSSEFWVTRQSTGGKNLKRDSVVEKEMNAVLNSRSPVNNRIGHIQIRFDCNGSVAIETNDHPVKYK